MTYNSDGSGRFLAGIKMSSKNSKVTNSPDSSQRASFPTITSPRNGLNRTSVKRTGKSTDALPGCSIPVPIYTVKRPLRISEDQQQVAEETENKLTID